MNKTANYEFTIIVPLYNEIESINRLENTLKNYLVHATKKSCILFVNDGSTDGSLDKIVCCCERNNDMFYLSLAKNRGLSTALKAGIDNTASPYIGYIDADMQTSPEDFNLLLPYADQYALVTGIRILRQDSFLKRLSSKVANSFRRFMTHDNAIDTGCPLKVMQAKYAKNIPFFDGLHRFIPAMIMLQGGNYKQIPVRHYARMEGEAKYNFKNRLFAPFIDCFAFQWMKRRYIDYAVGAQDLLTES